MYNNDMEESVSMTDRRGEYAKIEIDYIPREEIMGLKGGS